MNRRLTASLEWMWDRLGVPRGSVIFVESYDEGRQYGLMTQMLWDGAVTTRVHRGQDPEGLQRLAAKHWPIVRERVEILLRWIHRAVDWPNRAGWLLMGLWAVMELSLRLRGMDLSADLRSIADALVADALSWLFAAARTAVVGYLGRRVMNALSRSLIERLFSGEEG